MSLATVILAAGLGTRMKSDKAKVLHSVAGRPMIEYPVGMARALGSSRVICVLGHQADAVRGVVEARFGAGSIEVAIQAEQRGTGHAVLMTESLLAGHDGLVLILYGDTPLLSQQVLERLVHAASSTTLTMMTARLPDPRGYGRVVRDGSGKFVRIVEEKDATVEQKRLDEINAGIYCGPARFFFEALRSVGSNNAQGEIYLTDVMERAARELTVVTVSAGADEVMGINDRVDARQGRSRDPTAARRRADARRRRRARSRAALRRARRRGRARHVARAQRRAARQASKSAAAASSTQGGVITDCTVGDRVHVKPYCVIVGVDGGQRRADRPVGATSARAASSRTTCISATSSRPRRRAWAGRQGQPPELSRRRRRRRQGQHRLRHHHVQLRRLRQVAHRHRATARSSAPTRSWWRR